MNRRESAFVSPREACRIPSEKYSGNSSMTAQASGAQPRLGSRKSKPSRVAQNAMLVQASGFLRRWMIH
jgi:hypothetical protein